MRKRPITKEKVKIEQQQKYQFCTFYWRMVFISAEEEYDRYKAFWGDYDGDE